MSTTSDPDQKRVITSDYGSKVDPGPVSIPSRKLADDVGERGAGRCLQAAALLEYVEEEIPYDFSLPGGYNRAPVETWRKGGNCVDQSVLLASMLISIGIGCRLARLKKDAIRGHLIVEVFFEVPNVDRVIDDLDNFYSRSLTGREYFYERDNANRGYWFICDPTGSRHVGDAKGLDEYSVGSGSERELNIAGRIYPDIQDQEFKDS